MDYGNGFAGTCRKMAAKGNMGLDNYNWYLKNVHLSEYDATQALILAQRDYERNMANLAFHENMNRSVPALAAGDDARRSTTSATRRASSARGAGSNEDNILTLRRKTFPSTSGRACGGRRISTGGHETLFREPLVDKVHAGVPGHQYHSTIVSRHHRPIRAGFTATRMWGEGWGFYLEELGLQTRLLADRPRSKEIFDLWQAYRYNRVLFEIKAAARARWARATSSRYQLKMMPLMRENDETAWMEAGIALRRPQQIQYVLGKYQLEGFVARERLRLGRQVQPAGVPRPPVQGGADPRGAQRVGDHRQRPDAEEAEAGRTLLASRFRCGGSASHQLRWAECRR